MSTLSRGFLVLAVVFLAGIGLLVWKTKVAKSEGLTSLTKEDMELLIKDAPPQALKRLKEDADLRKKEIDNIKQFLALASEARKSGATSNPNIKGELENIRIEVLAASYDKEKNKEGGPMPPFGRIEQATIDAFFQNEANVAAFDKFIDTKVTLAKEDKIIPEDKVLTDQEKGQAKDYFAKTRIYEAEAKTAQLSEEFNKKVELQVGIQQAQYLARRYAKDELTKKLEVTDEELDAFIKANPEYDGSTKKAKADEVLAKAKAGEDFAKLADELSEDPGNKDPKTNKGKGGLYENIKKGDFVPEFENAALALQPGQIADTPIETQFGYHIIKLESKTTTKGKDGKDVESFTCRHILISTSAKDEQNPFAPPVSMKDKAKAKLSEDKQKKILDEISAKNGISVAEDFNIPEPSPEELQKMQEQMMQQRPPMGEDGQQQIDPKQMEQLKKQMEEMQKNAPKSAAPEKK